MQFLPALKSQVYGVSLHRIMIKKIKMIILSRIKHTTEEDWIKDRRETCLSCDFNTLNGGTLGYRFFLATLSSFYSWVMGKSKADVLGNCSICGCSVFYKSSEKEEACPKLMWQEPLKFKEIEDGSLVLDVRSSRKSISNRNNYLSK